MRKRNDLTFGSLGRNASAKGQRPVLGVAGDSGVDLTSLRPLAPPLPFAQVLALLLGNGGTFDKGDNVGA